MARIFTADDVSEAFGNDAATDFDPFAGLNPDQTAAVAATTGPLRILAGAGTGKTTVLIRRIANLVLSGQAAPGAILAVTFTKKAAAEMRTRLAHALGPQTARDLTVGNFHAICSDILRRHAQAIDLPQRFTVLDEDGQRDVIAEIGTSTGHLANRKDKTRINAFLNQIAAWKEEGLDVAAVRACADPADLVAPAVESDPAFLDAAALVFEGYQAELERRRWCDFADLVLHVVRIFRAHPEIRALEAGKFSHVLVDEFQDTSPVQNEFVRLMAQDHRNICVVGDTDQSIYEWRNARPEIMLGFPDAWPGCTSITIDTNYRSSQQILDLANTVVAPLRRKDGLDKHLTSARSGEDPREAIMTYSHGREEADHIAAAISDRLARGDNPGEIAVLCRSGMIISGIEKALRENEIRYVVAGAQKFTDREEIKDAIAWLTLAVNPDDYVAFSRIAGKPRRGLGPQKIAALRHTMLTQRCGLAKALSDLAAAQKPNSAVRRDVDAFAATLGAIVAIVANAGTAGDALEDILDESGYWAWRSENLEDPQHGLRLENLEQLIEEAREHESALAFLEMLALQSASDKDRDGDTVVISTVHAAKGLEFDTVFTPAMEEGIFPNARSERTAFGADEERRLAHVAWTRARKELFISFATSRIGAQSAGRPSRYINELFAPQRSTRRKLRRR